MAGNIDGLRKAFGDLVVEQAQQAAEALMAAERSKSAANQICRAGGQWYALTAAGRQHKRARDELAALGYVPYLPMEVVKQSRGRGSFRVLEQPMFGPYFFVRCPGTPACWVEVATARGVGRIVRTQGERPRPVPDGKIEVIRAYEAKLRSLDDAPRTHSGIVWHFSAGDMVRIKTGPFADFYAQLKTAVDSRDRIRAAIDIFGRSSVLEMSAFDIEAV